MEVTSSRDFTGSHPGLRCPSDLVGTPSHPFIAIGFSLFPVTSNYSMVSQMTHQGFCTNKTIPEPGLTATNKLPGFFFFF